MPCSILHTVLRHQAFLLAAGSFPAQLTALCALGSLCVHVCRAAEPVCRAHRQPLHGEARPLQGVRDDQVCTHTTLQCSMWLRALCSCL